LRLDELQRLGIGGCVAAAAWTRAPWELVFGLGRRGCGGLGFHELQRLRRGRLLAFVPALAMGTMRGLGRFVVLAHRMEFDMVRGGRARRRSGRLVHRRLGSRPLAVRFLASRLGVPWLFAARLLVTRFLAPGPGVFVALGMLRMRLR